MELDSPVTLSQYIWPICLPSATQVLPTGQSVWITGWGKTKEEGRKYESILLVFFNNYNNVNDCIHAVEQTEFSSY